MSTRSRPTNGVGERPESHYGLAMQSNTIDGRRWRGVPLPTWLLAAIFWIFTYSLFAYRAHLRYGEDYLLLSGQRFGCTLIGAGLFWFVMSNLIRVSGSKPAKPVAVIATILPASLVVLLARIVLGELVEGQPTELQSNMRWVLVWSGYFGLWVSAALALHTARLAKAAVDAEARSPACIPHATNRSAIAVSETSIQWIIDELAESLAAMPAAKRTEILQKLQSRAGYEIAEDLNPLAAEHNAKIRLVRDLAIRSRDRG